MDEEVRALGVRVVCEQEAGGKGEKVIFGVRVGGGVKHLEELRGL